MAAQVRTVAFHGIEVIEVETQVTITSGLPAFTVVGLPDKAVAESRERVRSALNSLGLSLPPKRITVNLAPADVLKEGSHFDLPIALALLVAMEALPADDLANHTALGELSLDGSITGVAGVLIAGLFAASHDSALICPAACGGEAAWAGEIEIIAAPNLLAIVNHFKGAQLLPPPEPRLAASTMAGLDLQDVKGQESAKRAIEIAAAGGHNLLIVEPIKSFPVRQSVTGEWRIIGETANRPPRNNRWWCLGHMVRDDLRPALTLLLCGEDRRLLVW